jgi:hypothetical protein
LRPIGGWRDRAVRDPWPLTPYFLYSSFVDETFQELMQRLGSAINDAITTSGEVDAALSDVREQATICVRQHDGKVVEGLEGEPASLEASESEPVDMSPEDRHFLKRLRISVDLEDPGEG